MHFIKASVLEALALDAVQKVAAYVLENEEAFTERIQAQWDIAQSDGMVSARKEITATENALQSWIIWSRGFMRVICPARYLTASLKSSWHSMTVNRLPLKQTGRIKGSVRGNQQQCRKAR